MPRYLFLELPGLKNPSSKLPPAETSVSLSFMDCPGVRVSIAKVLLIKKRSKHRTSSAKKASISVFAENGFFFSVRRQ
ncbi:hypothetical protein DITRI_Ditri14bG0124300 [Diplodiscus trichospermus]